MWAEVTGYCKATRELKATDECKGSSLKQICSGTEVSDCFQVMMQCIEDSPEFLC